MHRYLLIESHRRSVGTPLIEAQLRIFHDHDVTFTVKRIVHTICKC